MSLFNGHPHGKDEFTITKLRESIHKRGSADLAQKIDFAYFLYTKRFSCPNTKTTMHLIRSFKIIEL